MLVAGKYDLTNWKEDFKDYLEKNGMTPNTAKDYARRIEKIMQDENISPGVLFREIDKWIEEYKTGKYAAVNKRKHYAPSSALIKYKEFFPTTAKFPKQSCSRPSFDSIFKEIKVIY